MSDARRRHTILGLPEPARGSTLAQLTAFPGVGAMTTSNRRGFLSTVGAASVATAVGTRARAAGVAERVVLG